VTDTEQVLAAPPTAPPAPPTAPPTDLPTALPTASPTAPPSVRPPATPHDLRGRLLARRRQIKALRRRLVLADSLLTLVVIVLGLGTGQPAGAGMALLVALAVVAHVCAADSPRSIVSARSVVRSALILSGAAAMLNAAVGSRAFGRDALLGAACLGLALVSVRLLVAHTRLGARHGLGERRRLVVGDPGALESNAVRRAPAVESGELILVVTRAERAHGLTADDLLDVDEPEQERRQRRELSGPTGVVARVVRTALDNGAERVTVVPGDSWQQQQLRELSWSLEGTGIDMVIATNLDGIAPHRVDVVAQDGRLMIKVGSASPRGTQALVKGTVDRVVAAILLVLSAPLLLGVAAMVRLGSPGPAVFRQTRVREGGDTFTMYKFRTMTLGAEHQLSGLQELNMHGSDRPLFKMEEDPRITRVGHLLRKTSLDELPQLLNVLKGQMSLIGPRPALPLEVEMYDYVARRRLAVKPGMTGLWQVSGRSRLSWDESIGFDLDYVDNWSPGTDAAIVVRTFRAVVSKDGAF
jgi:exopolysaccharide biosynthesis polyprenyl glycosylphosphotransferase